MKFAKKKSVAENLPKNPTPISSKIALSAKTAVKIEILDPNYVHFHRSNPDLLERRPVS